MIIGATKLSKTAGDLKTRLDFGKKKAAVVNGVR